MGLLTIGQSPREDILSEIRPLFLSHIEILEKGLLDNLTPVEIKGLRPKGEENMLVTRLRDGSQVQLSEKKISSLLPEAVDSMKSKMRVLAAGVLCTNKFPRAKISFPVIFPYDYLNFLINHFFSVRNLGLVVPLKSQIAMAKKKWKKEKIVVEAKSPYAAPKSWEEIAGKFISEKVEAVILDCIGFRIRDKREIQNFLPVPILLPRTILAFGLNQLF